MSANLENHQQPDDQERQVASVDDERRGGSFLREIHTQQGQGVVKHDDRQETGDEGRQKIASGEQNSDRRSQPNKQQGTQRERASQVPLGLQLGDLLLPVGEILESIADIGPGNAFEPAGGDPHDGNHGLPGLLALDSLLHLDDLGLQFAIGLFLDPLLELVFLILGKRILQFLTAFDVTVVWLRS